MPTNFKQALNAELMADEAILYAGRPDWRAGWPLWIGAFLFGMFWSSIAWTFFASALAGLLGYANIKSGNGYASTGLLTFLLLFSLPFVAIGLGFLAAPFVGIYKARRTVHAVTTKRVIDICLSPASRTSYPLSKITFVKRRDAKNGFGNLQIGYGVEIDSEGDRRALSLNWAGIADVMRAERAIRQGVRWTT